MDVSYLRALSYHSYQVVLYSVTLFFRKWTELALRQYELVSLTAGCHAVMV